MARFERRHLQLAIALASVVGWACVDVQAGDDTTSAEHQQLRAEILASIADNVMAPRHAAFVDSAARLDETSAAYAHALAEGDDIDEARAAAQSAWADAMADWQVVEQLQLGPAASSLNAVGGADVRDEIYSWPSVNTCRVDQELVVGEYGEDDFQTTRLVNVYGLDALEYLLFWESADNSCAPQLPINQDGEWEALGEFEVAKRRGDYAASLSFNVATLAEELDATWAEGGEFHGHLTDAGQGASPYTSVDAAMDEVMRAIFYVDLVTKDEKLAKPLGIADCASEMCLEALESQWARVSKEAVAANLTGLRAVYLGGESPEAGTGFDDLLVEMGEDELAEELLAAIDAAIVHVDSVEGSFRDALLADPDGLDHVYDAIKRVTDLLKGDFAATLTLSIPNEGAGDAD